MRSRPEVKLQNYDAVYDFYENRESVMGVARFVHWAIEKVVKPETSVEDGALSAVEQHFNNSGRIILAASHVSMVDPFVLASVAEQESELHPLRGNIFIPGKAGIFTDMPYKLARRPILDRFVAVPTFRRKDEKLSGLPEEEAKALRRQATVRLISLFIAKADAGYNIAIFPDGERVSAGATDERIKSGIGRIACGLREPEKFMILPVGIHYIKDKPARFPSVHIGLPFPIDDSYDRVTQQVEREIRLAENLASQST